MCVVSISFQTLTGVILSLMHIFKKSTKTRYKVDNKNEHDYMHKTSSGVLMYIMCIERAELDLLERTEMRMLR